MANTYTLTQTLIPRGSKGRQGNGYAFNAAAPASSAGSPQTPLDWHSHSNLSLLQRLSFDNGYLMVSTASDDTQLPTPQKTKAAWADVAGEVAQSALIWKEFPKYVSKVNDDTVRGHLTFEKGLTSRQKAALQKGATFGSSEVYYVDEQGRAHLRTLAIEEHLEVPELRYNRTSVHIGYTLQSPAAGLILRVEQTNATAGKVFLKLEEGELGTVEVGDLLTGIFHATQAQGGATTDTDDGKLNLTFAGFATAFFEVVEIDPARQWFKYVLRSGTTFHPQPHMTFASRGNRTRDERKNFAVYTRSYTRYLRGVDDWEIQAQHVSMQQGELDNLHKLGFSEEIKGVGMFADNVFLTGKMLVGQQYKPVDKAFEDLQKEVDKKITDQAVYLQYSVDGVNAWHDVATSADRFMRQRKGNGAWSAALPFGRDGRDGRSYTPNLIDNSAFSKDLAQWWKNYPNAAITLDDSTASPVVGTRVLKILPNGGDHMYLATTIGKVLRPNTTYTFSVWAKQPAKASAAVFYVYGSTGQWEHIFGADGSWQHFTKTFTTGAEVKPDTTLCLLNFKNPDPSYVVYFAAPKLEEGSTASAWTSSETDRKGADGKPGQNGLPGKDGADGRSSYTHVRYSADGGQTFTAATAEALEAAKNLRGAGLNLASTLHLFKGYEFPWCSNGYASAVMLTRADELPSGAFRGMRVVQDAVNKGIFHYNRLTLAGGKSYTLSFWAKADAKRRLMYGVQNIVSPVVELTTEWKHYTLTFTLQASAVLILIFYGQEPGTFEYADVKLEEGGTATPWTPCALDAAAGTTPARYRGEWVSDQPVASLNPRVYAWVDTKGEKGNPGTPGVGVQEVVAEFATGTATAPTATWSTNLPPWTKGQYLWKRERITYTDGRVETTTPQRDDTWAKIGELSDQAGSATRLAADAAKEAEKAYNVAVDDSKVTAAEQRAIIKARTEALKSITYAEQARIKEQYAKVRLYMTTPTAVGSALANLMTIYNGAASDLINACTAYSQGNVFTDETYTQALGTPLAAYYNARGAINAALYESGTFEVGGRNLFGFKKGVMIEPLGNTFVADFAPEIRGIRMRCTRNVNAENIQHGVRIRNLGFERAGYYTASFTLVCKRAPGSPYTSPAPMAFDLCDVSPVEASTGQVSLTAKCNSYVLKSSYNGFFDFCNVPRASFSEGDVFELRDLMIERGTIASPWCKAEEDVEWELANAEYLRTVFDQTAGIDGGLIFGSMLQMRNTKGDVTAYLNGLRAKAGDDLTAWRFNRPALALGVRNFAKSGETEAIAFNFDGSGHLKNLYFNGQEEGFYMGSDPATSLVKFSTQNMPTIAELVANRTSSTSMNAETIVVEENPWHTYPKMARSVGRLEVRSVNGKLQGRVSLRVTGQASSSQNARPDVVVMAYLVSEDGTHRVGINISGHYNVDGRTFEADLYGSTLPLGKYYIEIVAYPSDVQSYRVEYKMLTDWSYVAIVDRGVYGIYKNGILAYENENRYAMFKDGRLVVKGDPDMPGVLVAGSASGGDGYAADYWGRKGNMLAKTTREAVGIYRINHFIYHKNYSTMITPIHPGKNLVATILRKELDFVQFVIREAHTAAQVDADFDFVLLGRT